MAVTSHRRPALGGDLLPGEPEDAEDPDEIQLWIDVYSELSRMVGGIARSAGPCQDHLHAHVDRLENRRDFWVSRRDRPPAS